MKTNLVLFISLTLLLEIATCARILGVFPVPSISHQVVYRALTTELAKRGHQLVIITTDPAFQTGQSPYSCNVTEIDVHDVSYPLLWKFMPTLTDPDNVHGGVVEFLANLIEVQLNIPEIQNLLKNEKKDAFDLIFAEIVPIGSLKFATKFDAPIIGISSMDVVDKVLREVGVPTHPIAYPSVFETEMRFKNVFDRLKALIRHIKNEFETYNSMKYIDANSGMLEDKTPMADLFSRIDLLFINLNHIWVGSRPAPPNVIYTGSMHLQPQKPLQGEIKDILDENIHSGVIYVSFGTNILAKNLPIRFLQLLANAFKKLPFTVFWKFEEDKLPIKLPSNVIIKKWFPQRDMFGHPSIKAFVTQCGQQSIDEAIRSHIPMVAIPFLFDQHKNADRIDEFGIGIQLDVNSMTSDELEKSLLKIISNKGYKENITKLSNLMQDEPMSDIEKAVWWTEYLIRNKGAKHFRGPATTIPYYQFLFLDVIALIILTMSVIFYVMKKIINLLNETELVKAKLKTH